MRIHTSATKEEIYRLAGDLPGVYIENLTEHRSMTHERAFELALSGNGSHASQWGNRDEKSATWDEWGVVMARIFAIDPNTRMGGTVKRPGYANAEDFRWQTNGRFGGWEPASIDVRGRSPLDTDKFVASGMPSDTHPVHRWEFQGHSVTGSYSVQQCKKCSALKRWKISKYETA